MFQGINGLFLDICKDENTYGHKEWYSTFLEEHQTKGLDLFL